MSAAAVSALEAVLNHPAVWRGNECARVAPAVSTGFAELDAELPGSGWPTGAITEIYAERTGIGELKLVMPAAARLTQSGRWLTVVTPPHVPYAPALSADGVCLERLLVVEPSTVEDRLWAAEQALRASHCGAVLCWQDHIHERALRRLQLAAESAGTMLFLFRSARVAPASPAALRLHVSRVEGRTIVRILKRRGGGLPAPIALDLYPSYRRRVVRVNDHTIDADGVLSLSRREVTNFQNSSRRYEATKNSSSRREAGIQATPI